jgi:hypothetical protein
MGALIAWVLVVAYWGACIYLIQMARRDLREMKREDEERRKRKY